MLTSKKTSSLNLNSLSLLCASEMRFAVVQIGLQLWAHPNLA